MHRGSLVLISLALCCAGAQTISFEPARHFGLDASAAAEQKYGFWRVLSGDWNGDGKTDLAALAFDSIWIFEGDGYGNFRPVAKVDVEALFVAAADVNADGRTDLLVLSHWSDPLRAANQELLVFLNEGQFRFGTPLRLRPPGVPWVGFQAADLNRDGKSDLLVFPNGSNVSVLLGNGDGTFSQPLRTAVFFSFFLGVDDFDQDGFPDLLALDWSGGVQIQFGRGDGTFREEPVVVDGTRLKGGWCAIGAADADGDYKPDLWVGGDNLYCPGVSVLRGSGLGTFETWWSVPEFSPQISASRLFADFNRDGFPDLVALPRIYAGNGTVGFVEAVMLTDLPASGYGLVVDVNGDGKPDLVICDSTLGLILLLNNSPNSRPPERRRQA